MRAADDEMESRTEVALRTYADPGESVDTQLLASRIIAVIQRENNGERRIAGSSGFRRRWAWALIAAAVTCSVIFLSLSSWQGKPRATTPDTLPSRIAAAAPSVLSATRPTATHSIAARKNDRVVKVMAKREPPKLDRFPSTTPLDAQEELLVSFAQHNSSAAQKLSLQGPEAPKPLHIAELNIAPLDKANKAIQGENK